MDYFRLNLKSVFGIFIFFLFLFSFSRAVFAYDASDVLGQFDENGDPSFIEGGSNSVSNPNDQGFLQQIKGFAIDEINHRLFVSDTSAYRVLVFNLTNDNVLDDRIADYVLGQEDFVSAVGPLSPHQNDFPNGPDALAHDPANNLLFVGTQHRVLVFDLSGGITNGMNATYVLGANNFTTAGGSTTQSTFSTVGGLFYDIANERLFVSNYNNNRVLVFDLSSGITNGMNAAYVLGQSNFTTNTSGLTQSKMNLPYGVWFDAGSNKLFVADSGNHRILVYDLSLGITDGMNASNVLGQSNFTTGTSGRTQSKMNTPRGVSYDPVRNYLFVGDWQNERVLVFDLSGGLTDNMNSGYVLGVDNFTSFGGSNIEVGNRLVAPILFAPDSGYLYTGCMHDSGACQARALIFDVETIANGMDPIDVLGHFDVDTDDPIFTVGSSFAFNAQGKTGYEGASDVYVDPENHRLFVYDYQNSRVLVYGLDSNNDLIDRVPDTVLGDDDFWPRPNNTVSASGFSYGGEPGGLEYDAENEYLFVSDKGFNRITVFDLSGGITNGMDASYVIGQEDFLTSGGTDTNQDSFYGVIDLAYDPINQLLFAADQNNYRILIFDLSGGITNGMDASYVIGAEDFVSQGGSIGQDGFYPDDLEYDPEREYLYVGDVGAGRILIFDLSNGITNGMDASYVLGQADFISGDVGTTQNLFGGYVGYALGLDAESGLLFVDDGNNLRTLVFDVSRTITNGMDAIAVISAPDFETMGTGETSQSSFYPTYNFFVDSSTSRFYVPDYNGSRVLIFDLPRITTTTLPNGTVGTMYNQAILTEDSQGAETVTLDSGTLPPGLVLGSVTGTPTTAGTYTFTLKVTDDLGDAGELFDLQEYTMTVVAEAAEEESSSSSSSSGTRFGCKDPKATNYREFSKHKQELCKYSVSPSSQSTTLGTPGLCLPSQILTQNLKAPSRDGHYGSYTKDIVKEVKILQAHLNRLGFQSGPVDGIIGPITDGAIKRMQTFLGTTPDGLVGPITRGLINNSCGV